MKFRAIFVKYLIDEIAILCYNYSHKTKIKTVTKTCDVYTVIKESSRRWKAGMTERNIITSESGKERHLPSNNSPLVPRESTGLDGVRKWHAGMQFEWYRGFELSNSSQSIEANFFIT